MTDEDAPLRQALDWLERGQRTVLATVVGTWGSSPRPPGSLLAMADDGAFVGSVSGGCIEGAVVEAGHRVMHDDRPALLDFGVSDEQAWQVGLACGGKIEVFVEPAPEPAVLRELLERRPVALVTDLQADAGSPRHALVRPEQPDDQEGGPPSPRTAPSTAPSTTPSTAPSTALSIAAVDAALQALAEDRSIRIDRGGRPLFVTAFNPPLRMIIVGAVHIAQALAPMAAGLSFRVTVIDPRQSFGSASRMPGVTLSSDWPDAAMAALQPDGRTAVVTLSHDPRLDDPALQAALRSPAFYIGALGSKKTHALRRQRLSDAGFGEDDLARIHGPAGLELGGRKAAEIALAILAEVVAVRYHRAPQPAASGTR